MKIFFFLPDFVIVVIHSYLINRIEYTRKPESYLPVNKNEYKIKNYLHFLLIYYFHCFIIKLLEQVIVLLIGHIYIISNISHTIFYFFQRI